MRGSPPSRDAETIVELRRTDHAIAFSPQAAFGRFAYISRANDPAAGRWPRIDV